VKRKKRDERKKHDVDNEIAKFLDEHCTEIKEETVTCDSGLNQGAITLSPAEVSCVNAFAKLSNIRSRNEMIEKFKALGLIN